MNSSMRSLFLATAAGLSVLALTTLPQKAYAQLVTNGGFETGNLTGWSTSGSTTFFGVTNSAGFPHTGSFGLAGGTVGGITSLSQSLATVAGQSYTFSYWVSNKDSGAPNSFAAKWNGSVLQSLVNASASAYTQYSYAVVATSASTLIQFDIRHDPFYWALDDISVTSNTPSALTPEMPAGALLLFALVPVGFLAMKNRRKSTLA